MEAQQIQQEEINQIVPKLAVRNREALIQAVLEFSALSLAIINQPTRKPVAILQLVPKVPKV
ncbi:hypothetical protein HYFRA_00007251 [Hymenoscyphus fraxineus]|uniref:Uncharacterized protein n=1 Tax=Hymenoscyphus fraxineus TaxID=746836 RepID=A0A9N9PJ11_9HELO|nr:hypothetical protein HYFRA_00007251 [Hymenoscyphus fraxineus]